MSSFYFLTPLQMAAATSMTTPEQDDHLLKIMQNADPLDIEGCIEASQYVIGLFGMSQINEQVKRIRRGEVPLPPQFEHLKGMF